MRATDILERYRLRGGLAYEGEGVTQLQHAWQSGQLAKRSAAAPDSRRSLALQGGPMGPTAWMQFAKTCFAADAVRLRVWDDHAKVASLQPVSTEAALSELARLMDAVSERGG